MVTFRLLGRGCWVNGNVILVDNFDWIQHEKIRKTLNTAYNNRQLFCKDIPQLGALTKLFQKVNNKFLSRPTLLLVFCYFSIFTEYKLA